MINQVNQNNTIIHQFLHNRNLTPEDAYYLSTPQWVHQHDPRQLRGVSQWIRALHRFHPIELNRVPNIAIIPDYDADGVLSGTLARVGLSMLGFGDSYVYAPSAFDGYGLSKESVDKVLSARPDTEVIITTDNGSNAHAGIRYAKSKGLTVLVTDHHLADTPSGADAEVNPNNNIGGTHDAYPFTEISGTAVIYKALQAYALTYNADVFSKLDVLVLLVGASTISDVMPLQNENRYFVTESVNMLTRFVNSHTPERVTRYGDTPLEQYFRGVDLLVMALNQRGKLKYGINADTFGFTIGPMLNSPRRMTGESEAAFDLFLTTQDDLRFMEDTPGDALFTMNEDRKTLVNNMTASLYGYIERTGPVSASHTVFNAAMGSGIAGLLAGRFTQEYDLPAIAFSYPGEVPVGASPINADTSLLNSETLMSGSARSPQFFDLHAFLTEIDQSHPGLIVKWGGHAQAAGISIRAGDFNRFRSIFARMLADIASEPQTDLSIGPSIEADLVLPIRGEYLLTSPVYNDIRQRDVLKTPDDVFVIDVPHNDRLYGNGIVSELSESIQFFKSLEPYGHGFTAPVFSVLIDMNDVKVFYMGAEKQHVKLTLKNGLSVIKWNSADMIRDHIIEGQPDHRVFAASGLLSVNEFNGRVSLQLMADALDFVG